MRCVTFLFCVILTTATAVSAQTQATSAPDSASVSPATQTSASPQKEEDHPEPEHTGWGSLIKDTGRDFAAFPKRPSTWVLIGMGAAGALAAHPADDYVERHIVGSRTASNVFKLGRWVGSAQVQVGTAVGLWAVGRYVIPPAADEPQTNKTSHLGFDLIRAQIVSQAIVHTMKISIRRDRPTGECCAFPSGHAATAFAAAAVLERHLGYRGSWPALAAATYVATSRLVDNRHFLSDVIFGAAIGEAAGWTVVGRHGRNEWAVYPVAMPGGGMMIAFAKEPNP
jgi:membrane-associated phospholipid phosphatase